VVLIGVRVPRNAVMERWALACWRDLLDRTLIAHACPLKPLPRQITEPDEISHLDIRRRQRLGGVLHEYKRAS
jgi:hypothetical protein